MRTASLFLTLLLVGPTHADDFRDLFNGKDFDGWVVDGPKVDKKTNEPIWRVKDGLIVCSGKGLGFLRYEKQEYADFAFRVEFRMSAKCNSGLGIRARPYDETKSTLTRPSYYSYEIQINDDAGKPPNKHGTGSLYRYVAPTANPVKPAGEWNVMEVECVGPRIKVTLNGQKVLDAIQNEIPDIDPKDDPTKPKGIAPPKDKPLKGFVCLQTHSNHIEFRKVQIREIKAE